MKKTKILILIIISSFILTYLSGCFISVSFDITTWSNEGRALTILATFIMSMFAIISAKNNDVI